GVRGHARDIAVVFPFLHRPQPTPGSKRAKAAEHYQPNAKGVDGADVRVRRLVHNTRIRCVLLVVFAVVRHSSNVGAGTASRPGARARYPSADHSPGTADA